MGDTMSYIGVNLPHPLVSSIDKILETGYRGYRSRAEFIADAIRRLLDIVETNLKEDSE